MSRLLRGAAGVAAILALLPMGHAHAMHLSARDAVVLRYRFTPGTTYTYHLSVTMKMTMSGTGLPTTGGSTYTATSTASGLAQYRILKVDASGATAEMTTRNMRVTVTAAGKTTTTALTAQPQTVHLGLDGSVQGGSGAGTGIGLQSVGGLPSGAVAPGARWTSTAVAQIPNVVAASMPPMRMTAQNVFTRLQQVDGQQAAEIHSSGSLAYVTDTPLNGQTWHVHVAAALQGQQLFGLAVHRLITGEANMDMRMFMSGPAVAGQTPAMRLHFVITTSMTPAGW